MRFSAGNDTGGHPRWWLYGDNNKTVATSGEAFDSLSNAKRAAQNFKDGAKTWNYEVYEDAGGNFRWRAKSSNGAKVAVSGESFASKFNAERAAENVRNNAGGATGP